MKFVRYGIFGDEKPGVLDHNGHIRDLSNMFDDFTPHQLAASSWLDALHTIDICQLPLIASPVRLGACVAAPGKILCIGFNTKAHALEMDKQLLENQEIMVFLKPSSALCGPNDPIPYSKMMRKLDWEAELAIIIGKEGKYISAKEAHNYIFGYACMNDLSDRYLQFEVNDKQFTKAKGFDNAAPLGPYLVTADEIDDVNQLRLRLWVNGELRQDFYANEYLHKEAELISYLSQFFTLYPGDVISMGSGSGSARSHNHQFLQIGDNISMCITGLGQQDQTIVNERNTTKKL